MGWVHNAFWGVEIWNFIKIVRAPSAAAYKNTWRNGHFPLPFLRHGWFLHTRTGPVNDSTLADGVNFYIITVWALERICVWARASILWRGGSPQTESKKRRWGVRGGNKQHTLRAALNPFVIRNNTVYYLCIKELQAAELVEFDFSCIIASTIAEGPQLRDALSLN